MSCNINHKKIDKLFGTDGIRGRVDEWPLTKEVVFALGQAIGKHLGGKGRLLIAKDTRHSCDRIEQILASGLKFCGIEVYSAGVIPTPGLAFLTKKLKMDIGAMISASHNLAADNGIKFFRKDGFKISERIEQKIEAIILANLKNNCKAGDLKHVRGLGNKKPIDDYIDFLKESCRGADFSGLKIVIDCANGAVSAIGKRLFNELGIEIISIHDNPNGQNINLNCGSLHPHHVACAVVKERADLGFSFDGDGDRVIVTDEKGTILNGDHIMAMCALDMHKEKTLRKNTVVTTIMSNLGFYLAMKEAQIKVVTAKVGDKFVLDEMLKGGYNLGGEQSGHIIFLDYTTTGDGLITALQVLKLLKKTNKNLSKFSRCIIVYPQVLLNVKVREKVPIEHLAEVEKEIKNAEKKLKSQGRVVVRYSGTEPLLRIMVEGKSQESINNIANKIADKVKEKIGVR